MPSDKINQKLNKYIIPEKELIARKHSPNFWGLTDVHEEQKETKDRNPKSGLVFIAKKDFSNGKLIFLSHLNRHVMGGLR